MRLAILALAATLSGCGITDATVWDGDFALSFSGKDCVEAAGDPETIGVALTVEAWVRALDTPPQGRGVIVSMGEAGALWASPDGTGFSKPDEYTSTGWSTGVDIFDDERHHVASVWSADEGGVIFVDGFRSGTNASWTEVPGFDTIRIGCAQGRSSPFLGVIDEVRISSAVRYSLTAFQVPEQPFEADGDTIALYHFDLGTGDRVLEQRDQFPGVIKGATWTDGLLDAYSEPLDTEF